MVLDDPVPDAYALDGLLGRIVVSTAMLRALVADERRALLAHESAHLPPGDIQASARGAAPDGRL